MVIYARWLDALMRAVCYLAAYIDDNESEQQTNCSETKRKQNWYSRNGLGSYQNVSSAYT